MREVVYKNLYSQKAHKREVCIEEIIQENGCKSRTLKKSLYFVQSICTLGSEEEFNSWLKQKEAQENPKRNFHIMKIHSDIHNVNTVICKAKGAFYIVSGREVYNIVYLHLLRMEISGPRAEKVS
ncbi:MAG: hypothetical protein PHS37_07035 [Candidatus Omnitrophica bacterium]|nr:hypothetical protein [Candidatus Omnitrophota bacterium]